MKRISLLVFLILLVFNQPSFSGVKENTEDLEEVKSQIKSIDKEIKKDIAKKSDLNKELKNQEKKISQTRKEIHSIKKKSKKNQEKLQKLQQEQKNLNEQINKKRDYLSKFLVDYHKKGDSSYLQSIINGENPNSISRNQKLQSFYTNAQISLINDLQEDNKKLIDTQQIIEKTIKKIEILKSEKSKTAKKLEMEKKGKKQLLASVNKTIQTKQQIKNKLIEDEKKLKSIIDELVKKAAEEEKLRLKQKNVKKDKPSEKVLPFKGGSFNKLKGKLQLPTKGKVKYKFNTKRKDTGVKWKGVFISADEGQEVKAVGDGKIAYADWLRGFGNLVIIDHGNGYMSLYGYNESVVVNVNDNVKTADTIATVGNTGGIGVSGLYYELRKNSKPFDPLSWTKK